MKDFLKLNLLMLQILNLSLTWTITTLLTTSSLLSLLNLLIRFSFLALCDFLGILPTPAPAKPIVAIPDAINFALSNTFILIYSFLISVYLDLILFFRRVKKINFLQYKVSRVVFMGT